MLMDANKISTLHSECINAIIDSDNNFLKAFGLLVIQTTENTTVLRPIGGRYGNGINDAIEEMDKNYPNCKMKILFEYNDSVKKYLIPNGISSDWLLC